MKPSLSMLVRNRKVHFVAIVTTLMVVVFNALHRQGIDINYLPDDPHARVMAYQTISDQIKNGFFVTDVRIQRCLRGFTCLAPANNLPAFWVEYPTKLNLYLAQFHFFNYYMYVEKTKGNEALRFVLDVQFTPKNEEPKGAKENTKWMSHKILSNAYVWINYIEQIDFTLPTVRDINVLYGKHDMVDTREHWKFSPLPVVLPVKQSIQPKMSMLMVAVNDEMAIFNKDQFDAVLKKNEIITTVNPLFKVLQISDMHIGQDAQLCTEEKNDKGEKSEKCKFDVNTLNFVHEVLSVEGDVNLVVLTGDLIDFGRVKHFELAVLKALAPILKARIPFVFTFGDSEHEWSDPRTKINILNFIASLPGSYNKRASELDSRMHGMTNGNIKVYRIPAAGTDQKYDYLKLALEKPSAVLTYLDSEQMYVDETQSTYLYRILQRMSKVDFKLLFFHNPLPNFRPKNKFKLVGSYNEKHQLNSKLLEKFLTDAKTCGYRAVCVGHEHENDACIWDDNEKKLALLCYSGVAGESAETRINKDFERRVRLFELNFEKPEILSWKRKMLADSKIEQIDVQQVWSKDQGEAKPKEQGETKPQE